MSKGKEIKQTLIEFVADEKDCTLVYAEKFLKELMSAIIDLPIHNGDCKKENFVCNLCLLETILSDYREAENESL
jgi:hypothetical protein